MLAEFFFNSLLLRNSDVIVKEFVNSNVCRRVSLLKIFPGFLGCKVSGCDCCDVCAIICDCGDTSCKEHSYLQIEGVPTEAVKSKKKKLFVC